MMADDVDAAGDLWAFALKVYVGEGVSAACLDLQDRFGADVPVLLTVLWMAKRDLRLNAEGMAALETRIGPWRAEMVAPLRALRRRLKEGPAPAPSDATEALRTEIKRAELHAEKIELVNLAGCVSEMARPSGPAGFRGNLMVAMTFYAPGADVPDALVTPLVAAAEAA